MIEETEEEKRALLEKKKALLEQKKRLKEGLPFLYGWKHYKWSREYMESKNHENFLVAANQIGKSSVNIRKCIHWATDPSLWPELWNTELLGHPNQFWYLYPSSAVGSIEFKTKWSLFLPQGEFKNHPQYGWHAQYERKQIHALHFNTGVSVYFKTYAQNVQDLQTGTCFAVFCDEELPEELLPELQARLNASDGYFHLVFTATLGQEHWRRCMEEQGGQLETHKGAFKLNVSLLDCKEFEDGTPSHWTDEKIKRAIAKCPNKQEVLRRIYGRFVIGTGLVYASYEHERNSEETVVGVPKGWLVYSGVDIGSGGESGHPSAIVFIAVSPDYKQGQIFRGWRGDGVETDPGDVLIKYRELRGDMIMSGEAYDHSARDFFTVASRLGEGFVPADKNRERGIGLINTLFKHRMLKVQRGDSELEKLITELTTLLTTTPKTKAKDDFCDALRYAAMEVPWDLQAVEDNIDLEEKLKDALKPARKQKVLSETEWIDKQRRDMRDRMYQDSTEPGGMSQELQEWADEFDF